jgi:hypothetical protein
MIAVPTIHSNLNITNKEKDIHVYYDNDLLVSIKFPSNKIIYHSLPFLTE